MQKTKSAIYIPLSNNARKWLPERGGDIVFEVDLHKAYISEFITKWVKSQGIHKHITFHCARHTFATLALTYGADIYTVSKLLGHSDIETTQIYAKVVDRKKIEAVNLIPDV